MNYFTQNFQNKRYKYHWTQNELFITICYSDNILVWTRKSHSFLLPATKDPWCPNRRSSPRGLEVPVKHNPPAWFYLWWSRFLFLSTHGETHLISLSFGSTQSNQHEKKKRWSHDKQVSNERAAASTSEGRVEEDGPEHTTSDLIHHGQQKEGETGGDRTDKHTTSPRPDPSGGSEEEAARRLFTLSIMSGRLVAASTVTSRSCSTPSISVSSWARTRSPTPPEPEELRGTDKEKREMKWMRSKRKRIVFRWMLESMMEQEDGK